MKQLIFVLILIIGFQTGWYLQMDHKAYVAFIYAHAKGVGRDHEATSTIHEQFLVLFTQIGALGFAARKVDLHQNEVLVRVLLKRRFGKDVLAQLDTIAAPVRAGEIQKHQFVAGLSLFLRLLDISLPAIVGAARKRQR